MKQREKDLKMEADKELQLVFNEAYNYLLDKVGKEVLEKQLNYYYSYRSKSINDIFKRMVASQKNKQGYVNFIAPLEEMREILLDFDPYKVMQLYDNWEKLFEAFKLKYGNKYKMDPNNKKNAWVIFTKGVLSSAKFISNFKSLQDFDKFVKSFFYNEYTIASLPMLLDTEIFGFGFPLACDFLKELGYVQYGKPDIHLKDIFTQLNLVENNSDYEVFKKIVKIGLLVNKDPVIVDKVFWLIGSGNFYDSGIKLGRQKDKFISKTRLKLSTADP